MAYTTIDDPSAHFQTTTYTGSGSSGNAITNSGNSDLKPDWLWIKSRSDTEQHTVYDSSRGSTKRLMPDATNAEFVNSTQGIQSFNTDGFTLGENDQNNKSSQNCVAWQWKANGGTTSSNSNGSITSTVQANTTAGFSIVTYTGNATAGATIGHGLGVKPAVIIVKQRTDSAEWLFNSHAFANNKAMYLNTTDALATDSFLNSTDPTTTVFTINGSNGANGSSDNLVAYCFAEVKGYSKFGSYTANGNVDGPFVYTGFKPAWVMFKQTNSSDTAHWFIYDSTRSPTNVIGDVGLAANLTNVEGLGSTWNPNTSDSVVDFVSNGFKIRTTATAGFNISGNTMIYMAFAEHPFVSSKGVPVTAR